MSKRYAGDTALTWRGTNSVSTVLPSGVVDALGNPERIAWFVDTETGRIVVAPKSEVTLND